jgi:hypothetical protein
VKRFVVKAAAADFTRSRRKVWSDITLWEFYHATPNS